MLVRGHPFVSWPSKSHIPWLVLAFGLMFVAAYSIARLFAAIASVSALTGLPEYAHEIPKIQAEARWWETLAIVLPFFAALVLSIPKTRSAISAGSGSTPSLTYPAESQTEKWASPFVQYLTRLVISVLGTFGFLVCLLLVGFLLHKLHLE
jgi:hypothetical protein